MIELVKLTNQKRLDLKEPKIISLHIYHRFEPKPKLLSFTIYTAAK